VRIAVKTVGLVILGWFVGCALPAPPDVELNDFVPPEEIRLAYLAKEAMWYFGRSRYLDAELKFRQILWLRPDLKNMKQNLAETLGREGLYEEAVQLYLELVQEDPQALSRLSGLARLYYMAGKFDLARLQYEKALAVAIDRNDLGLMAKLARSLAVLSFKVGNEEEAGCYSAQALLWGATPDEFLRHISLLMAMGYYNAAMNALKKYVLDNELERDPLFLHKRAMLSFALHKFDDAYAFETMAQEAALGRNVDPATQFEMNVVKFMAQRVRLKLTAEGAKDTEIDQAGKEFLQALEIYALTNQAFTVYWPANLVEMLQELLAERKP